jgi:hypothetical protein
MSEDKKNDGGPAYPRPASEGGGRGYGEQDGMSLRDYFAGQVLLGIYAANDGDHVKDLGGQPGVSIARLAYLQADYMLDARKENK